MAIGDILKGIGGAASLIPGVGSIAGAGLGLLGAILPTDADAEAKKKEEEAKRKAAEAAILKQKQAGDTSQSEGAPIANPNMAVLAQQLQQQGMPQVAGMGGVSGLLNNRRY